MMEIKYIEEEDKILIVPKTPDDVRILKSFIGKLIGFAHVRGLVIKKEDS